MSKGALIFSEETNPKLIRNRKKWMRIRVINSCALMAVFISSLLLVLINLLHNAFYDVFLFIVIALISLFFALFVYAIAQYVQPLRIYENGIEISDISYLSKIELIRGKREVYVPFSNIAFIVLNTNLEEYPGIAIETKNNDEFIIPKIDIIDHKKFNELIRLKVKDVRDNPPQNE